MRIWSIHPKFLDSKRLVAQWREALLCRAVLEGKTIGYTKHPQFLRVKNHSQPHYFINLFLYEIWQEGNNRGYSFDKSKLMEDILSKYQDPFDFMEVTDGQLYYEFKHLQSKLGEFNKQYIINEQYLLEEGILPNPCFLNVCGDIMKFEKINTEL